MRRGILLMGYLSLAGACSRAKQGDAATPSIGTPEPFARDATTSSVVPTPPVASATPSDSLGHPPPSPAAPASTASASSGGSQLATVAGTKMPEWPAWKNPATRIAADCSAPSVELLRGSGSLSAISLELLRVFSQFRVVAPGQARLAFEISFEEVNDGPEHVLVARCFDTQTCERFGALHDRAASDQAPRLRCNQQGAATNARPAIAPGAIANGATPNARCARVRACQIIENQGLTECEEAPRVAGCARLADCQKVTECAQRAADEQPPPRNPNLPSARPQKIPQPARGRGF